jgi:hypothetical protein
MLKSSQHFAVEYCRHSARANRFARRFRMPGAQILQETQPAKRRLALISVSATLLLILEPRNKFRWRRSWRAVGPLAVALYPATSSWRALVSFAKWPIVWNLPQTQSTAWKHPLKAAPDCEEAFVKPQTAVKTEPRPLRVGAGESLSGKPTSGVNT